MELSALEELEEAGFSTNSRLKSRGNLGGKTIPDNRSELFVAAKEEIWG